MTELSVNGVWRALFCSQNLWRCGPSCLPGLLKVYQTEETTSRSQERKVKSW